MPRLFRTAVITVLLATVSCSHAAADAEIITDVVYGHKYGLAMTFDVYPPPGESNGAGVLFMVSGGWYSKWQPAENFLQWFQPLMDRGFTVFSVRHGSSPKFTIPEAVGDVRRAVRFIRTNADQWDVDPDRLGVFGLSAGGHLSLVLGTASDAGDPQAEDPVKRAANRVQAVVAFVAPTDLRIMVWDAPNRLPAYKNFPALDLDVDSAADFSPLVHVSQDDPPTLLIAGDKDELVPVKHSRDIYAAMQAENVTAELLEIEGAGHGFEPEDMRRALAAMVAWFEKHLGDK